MWRLVALFFLVAIIACVGAWLFTGQVRYRRWATRLGQLGLLLLFLFFGLLFFERLMN